MRFVWQAWDSGCMSALGKALEGGSAWQVWGNVHLDVGARAFHVAGVGKGGHRRCRERGFAWPAWGSVHAACVSRGRRGEWCKAAETARFRGPVREFGCAGACSRVRCSKSWQAQGIRGLVDESLERAFLGTQRQAASGVSRVRRCAMGIAGGRVAWVALRHVDCWWACRVGGAAPCGLLVGVSRGWRCAVRIAGGRVAWVAPCLRDC